MIVHLVVLKRVRPLHKLPGSIVYLLGAHGCPSIEWLHGKCYGVGRESLSDTRRLAHEQVHHRRENPLFPWTIFVQGLSTRSFHAPGVPAVTSVLAGSGSANIPGEGEDTADSMARSHCPGQYHLRPYIYAWPLDIAGKTS